MRKSSAGSGSYFLEPPVLVFSTILQFAAAGILGVPLAVFGWVGVPSEREVEELESVT